MSAVLAFLFAPLLRVSPYVLAQLRPILIASSARIWKAAYPIAVGIVKDLADDGKFNDSQAVDGLDKHKAAVQRLHLALIATGKFSADEINKLHLGQIILAAYANQFVPAK